MVRYGADDYPSSNATSSQILRLFLVLLLDDGPIEFIITARAEEYPADENRCRTICQVCLTARFLCKRNRFSGELTDRGRCAIVPLLTCEHSQAGGPVGLSLCVPLGDVLMHGFSSISVYSQGKSKVNYL